MALAQSFLVVDEFDTSRVLIGQLLEKKGYKVSYTSDEADVATKVDSEGVDFVLLDVSSPDFNGYLAAKNIRDLGKKNVAIVGMARAIDEGVIDRCVEAGIDGCLCKPVSADELHTAVQQFCEREKDGFSRVEGESRLLGDTLEAIQVLTQMEVDDDPSVLPELFQFIDMPYVDEPVLIMARNLVQEMLPGHAPYILLGLVEGGPVTRDICVYNAGKLKLKEARPLLVKMLQESSSPAERQNLITALKRNQDPEIARGFLSFVGDPDTLTSVAAINALGFEGNDFAVDDLDRTLSNEEPIRAYAAAESLGEIANDAAIKSLVNEIHHSDSIVRKAVTDTLTRIGPKTCTAVADKMASGDLDETIMSANVLGNIGHYSAIEPLIKATHHKIHNARFAVYEALGKISSLEALSASCEAVTDDDYSVVCVAMEAINTNPMEPIIKILSGKLEQGDAVRNTLAKAVVDMRATEIFKAFQNDRRLLKAIIDQAARSKSSATLVAFVGAAEAIENKLTRTGAMSLLNKNLENLKEGDLRILAVDDSKTIRYLYESILPEAGYQVETAEDGQEAIDMFSEGKYDLVVTDMNMPNKNGIEFAKFIREEAQSKVPVIMVSTESQQSQKDEATQAGVNDFLTKPFTAESLESIVNKFV